MYIFNHIWEFNLIQGVTWHVAYEKSAAYTDVHASK